MTAQSALNCRYFSLIPARNRQFRKTKTSFACSFSSTLLRAIIQFPSKGKLKLTTGQKRKLIHCHEQQKKNSKLLQIVPSVVRFSRRTGRHRTARMQLGVFYFFVLQLPEKSKLFTLRLQLEEKKSHTDVRVAIIAFGFVGWENSVSRETGVFLAGSWAAEQVRSNLARNGRVEMRKV